MYGAILGDMIGSPYEFDMGDKTKDFPLFCGRSTFTDDTVMTIAVAQALMTGQVSREVIQSRLIDSMHRFAQLFPHAGYGAMFLRWLRGYDRKPYYSYGNGSAMRVSPVAWRYGDIQTVRLVARWTAEITHNHPEGIKGAEATACAIFLGRTGSSKARIRRYIEEEFG